MTISLASKDLIWMSNFCTYFFIERSVQLVSICYDNKVAIYLVKNRRFTSKSKHISRKYHYIRKLVRKGKVMLKYLPTDEMLADPLVKDTLGEKI